MIDKISDITLAIWAAFLAISTAIVSIFLDRIITGSNKVTTETFESFTADIKQDREKAWAMHDVDCKEKISPLLKEIKEVKTCVQAIQKTQAEMITVSHLETILKKGGFLDG